MRSTLYAYTDSGKQVVVGSGYFGSYLREGMVLSVVEIDPQSQIRIDLGDFLIYKIVLTVYGFRSGPQAIWQSSTYGTGPMVLYGSPLDDAAKKYVQFCEEQQCADPPGQQK